MMRRHRSLSEIQAARLILELSLSTPVRPAL